jgi:hypothetical protein
MRHDWFKRLMAAFATVLEEHASMTNVLAVL